MDLNSSTVVGLVAAGILVTGIIAALVWKLREPQDPAAQAERMRKDAQRFAQLLVSEIKLYNQRRVTEGCKQQDLYVRLREEIDRARAMYDKRVDWLVVDRDYFHDSVVEILCGGEAELLGEEYPGPVRAIH